MFLIDKWIDDASSYKYITIGLNEEEKVDFATRPDGFSYVMFCGDGMEVYKGTDTGVRMLTKEEEDTVWDFFEEQLRSF